jgi:hypothetical protein
MAHDKVLGRQEARAGDVSLIVSGALIVSLQDYYFGIAQMLREPLRRHQHLRVSSRSRTGLIGRKASARANEQRGK